MIHTLAVAALLKPCGTFTDNFYEYTACKRAEGTLATMRYLPGVEWRVRYFFKYNEMPCGEAPTVQESYVYQMASDDLETDSFVTPQERVEIRTAMFNGRARC